MLGAKPAREENCQRIACKVSPKWLMFLAPRRGGLAVPVVKKSSQSRAALLPALMKQPAPFWCSFCAQSTPRASVPSMTRQVFLQFVHPRDYQTTTEYNLLARPNLLEHMYTPTFNPVLYCEANRAGMLSTVLALEKEDPAGWLKHFLEFCQESSASKPGRKRQDEAKVFDFTRLSESRLGMGFCAEVLW